MHLKRHIIALVFFASAATLLSHLGFAGSGCDDLHQTKARHEVVTELVRKLAENDPAWQNDLSAPRLQERLTSLRELLEFVRSFDAAGSNPQEIFDVAARKNAAEQKLMELGLTRSEAEKFVHQLFGNPRLSQKLLTWTAEVEIKLTRERLPEFVVWTTAAIAATWTFTPVSILNTLAAYGVIGAWGFTPGTTQIEVAILYSTVLYGARITNFLRSHFQRLFYWNPVEVGPQETKPLDDLYAAMKPQVISRMNLFYSYMFDTAKRESMRILMSVAILFGGAQNLDHLFDESRRAYNSHSRAREALVDTDPVAPNPP